MGQPKRQRRDLPAGDWLFFFGDFSSEELQHLFLERTGIEIGIERISESKRGTIVSLSNTHVKALVDWAFTDDQIRGKRVRVDQSGYERCRT